ncbi:MAG: aminotransferase class IV [Marinilabiliaceae bacterium]|nr:aminotransferase class IV [Bacteroidales bacterium]MDY4521538.1 aminotransferase class IV [Bacteroidales bacterium]
MAEMEFTMLYLGFLHPQSYYIFMSLDSSLIFRPVVTDTEPVSPLSWFGAPMWCQKYFHDGRHHTLDEPFWGPFSSVRYGMQVTELIAMRGNEPYLWREHFRSLLAKLEAWNMDRYALPNADEMKRRIEVLASKNHYPPYSLIHIVVWTEVDGQSEYVDFAILQSRMPLDLFDLKPKPLWLCPPPSNVVVAKANVAMPGVDSILEASAHRAATLSGKDGAYLVNADGNIVRTTVGNLYLISPGKVTGVSTEAGALPDVLTDDLLKTIESERLGFELCDGFTPAHIRQSADFGCFVCNGALGLWPVMSLGLIRNDLDNTLSHSQPTFQTHIAKSLGGRLSSRFQV